MNLTLIIPAYNESEMIPILWEKLNATLSQLTDVQAHILFVNDGSADDTLLKLKQLAAQDSRVQIISLSRNFGKEAAMTAGIEAAVSQQTDGIIILDADLQDPPELIPQFVEKYRQGFEVAYGVRTDRASDSFLKRVTANGFYRVYNLLADAPLVPHAGDCRFLSRRAAEALLRLPERERFMKGLFAWIGFKSAPIPFARQARAAGRTKWNYFQLTRFALQGLTAGSTSVLKLGTYLGVVVSIGSVCFAAWVAFKKIMFGNPVSGYASLMVAILFCSGVQLISLGILGEYIGRIFMETKQRPLYIIDEKINC